MLDSYAQDWINYGSYSLVREGVGAARYLSPCFSNEASLWAWAAIRAKIRVNSSWLEAIPRGEAVSSWVAVANCRRYTTRKFRIMPPSSCSRMWQW